jgi:general secretion pathway protein H
VSRRAAGGFTLIEMMVVIMIIAIGITLAVPLIEGGLDAREVRRAARQIAATMLHCRVEAMSRSEPQGIVINAERNTIGTSDWGRWVRLTDRAVIENVEGGDDVGGGTRQFLCFPNGSTSGARVVIGSRRDRSAQRLEIRLDPLIGRVDVGDASA